MGTQTRAPHVSSWSAAGSAEGVGGAEDDVPVLGDERAGEVADGRGLAGPVDADDRGRPSFSQLGAAGRRRSGPWTGRPGRSRS